MIIKKRIVASILLTFGFFAGIFAEELESNTSLDSNILNNSEFTVSNGIVKIQMNQALGNFNLFAVSPEGKQTHVLSTFSPEVFFLKIDDVVFKLNRSGGVKYEFMQDSDTAKIRYDITTKKRNASVLLTMKIMPSTANVDPDMIKVTVETTNTGSNRQNFSLRAVFDTVLGEMAYATFSTAMEKRIQTERQFTSMLADRWIMSKNETTGLQFLLSGHDIVSPKLVTLANKDTILNGDWEGSYYKTDCSFNSVVSYANSAIDLLWKDFSLDAGQKTSVVFYMVLGVQAVEPAGRDFLSLPLANTSTVVPPVSTPTPVPASSETEENQTTSVEEVVNSPSLQEPDVEDVPFDVSTIKKEQLDSVYVQSLIEKINNLESSGFDSSSSELQKLNAELDEILKVLRSSR